MNEHGYIKSIHRVIPSDTYKWKIHDSYAGGVPDTFYCNVGGLLFVEYKYEPKVPKRQTTIITPDLSPNQVLWLEQRYAQNVPVAVIMGTPIGGVVFTDLTWRTGISRKELDNFALPPRGVASIIQSHCIGKTYVSNNDTVYSYDR